MKHFCLIPFALLFFFTFVTQPSLAWYPRTDRELQGKDIHYDRYSVVAAETLTNFGISEFDSPNLSISKNQIHNELVKISQGNVIRNEPNSETGHTWFEYFPNSLKKHIIASIVVTSVQISCYKEENDKEALEYINGIRFFSERYQLPLIVVSIPEHCSNTNPYANPYTLHFPEYVFTGNPKSIEYRPDLKVNSIVNIFKNKIRTSKYQYSEKIFLYGYSINGHFANRYSLLHPEKVQAFAAGGLSGLITLPISSYDGRTMDWFLGINNFESLVGKPFDHSLYRVIPQFYFWGELNLFPYHLEVFPEWVEVWGNNSVEALNKQCNYLRSQLRSVLCRQYPNVGHIWTTKKITDVFIFFAHNPTQGTRIFIEPPQARQAGAAWRKVGTQAWHPHGFMERLASGPHAIQFKPIQGWRQPPNRRVAVQQNRLMTIQAHYTITQGLRVIIEPVQARQAGAAWRKLGTQPWRPHGFMERLAAGPHAIQFRPVQGWRQPPNRQVAIQQNRLMTVQARYSRP